ncbi:hypothetical protein SAY86_029473 [Trapa natans]|uniref:Uncharacterized protein n=1 Tax=Trapa natans TaxID=22666 RepID=A0AAN7RBY6_TRANT|nr:hypothetical protein SAY86_029473 [Trapa natans]
MKNIFSKKPDPKEALRESKREMNRATRGVEKEIGALQLEQMAPAKQAKVMKEFQKQSAQLDMTTEMMSDAIDDALDDDEAEEEIEDLTNQVLDEIGVDVASQVQNFKSYPLFEIVYAFEKNKIVQIDSIPSYQFSAIFSTKRKDYVKAN